MPGDSRTMSPVPQLSFSRSAPGRWRRAARARQDSSGTGGGKVVLRYTWWGNPDRAARTEQAVSLFEKKHPGIEVQTSFADTTPTSRACTQGGRRRRPDVMQLDYRMIDQYASGGVLLTSVSGRRCAPTTSTRGCWPPGRGRQAVCCPAGPRHRDRGLRREAVEGGRVAPPAQGWTWDEWADAMRALAKKSQLAPPTRGRARTPSRCGCAAGQGPLHQGTGGSASPPTTWPAGGPSPTDCGARERSRRPNRPPSRRLGRTPRLGRGKAVSDFNWDAPSSGYRARPGSARPSRPCPRGADGTPGQYFKPSMFMGAAADTGPRPGRPAHRLHAQRPGGRRHPRRHPRHPGQRVDPQGPHPGPQGLRQDRRGLPATWKAASTPHHRPRPPATTRSRPPSSATTTRPPSSGCRPARRPGTTSPRRRRSCGHDHHRPPRRPGDRYPPVQVVEAHRQPRRLGVPHPGSGAAGHAPPDGGLALPTSPSPTTTCSTPRTGWACATTPRCSPGPALLALGRHDATSSSRYRCNWGSPSSSRSP